MKYNVACKYLNSSIWERILGFTGWQGSFDNFARTIGEADILSTSDKKNWKYTGGIRTRFLAGPGKYHEEEIVPDGTLVKGRRLSRAIDLKTRRLFRLFTYLRASTRQDPLSAKFYRLSYSCIKPNGHGPQIMDLEDRYKYYTQREFVMSSKSNYRLSLHYYDTCPRDKQEIEEPTIVMHPTNLLVNSRGGANYHLRYISRLSEPIPLAWKFEVKICNKLFRSFVGITNSKNIWSCMCTTSIDLFTVKGFEIGEYVYNETVNFELGLRTPLETNGLQLKPGSSIYSGLFQYDRYI